MFWLFFRLPYLFSFLQCTSSILNGYIEKRTFLAAYAKLRKANISLVMSVRPSVWNNSAPTGRILMYFYI